MLSVFVPFSLAVSIAFQSRFSGDAVCKSSSIPKPSKLNSLMFSVLNITIKLFQRCFLEIQSNFKIYFLFASLFFGVYYSAP
jgi:hypothetical protein